MIVLFVFAHQDDEYSAAPWIADEVNSGHAVSCLYLTDGASRTDAVIRDRESTTVLAELGVKPQDIHFLGTPDRIPDLGLAAHIEKAFLLLEEWVRDHRSCVSRIYAPAWEGGHPDHDALHLVALLAATKYSILEDAWQFSIYNGYRCRILFRSLKQLPTQEAQRWKQHSFREGFKYALLCWKYTSQRRTWLGLFPGAFIHRALLRREAVVRFDRERALTRPHKGPLLYERLFNMSYERFIGLVTSIRNEIVSK
jgi:LmbE family N-acetylglucosaminyl deacetylase